MSAGSVSKLLYGFWTKSKENWKWLDDEQLHFKNNKSKLWGGGVGRWGWGGRQGSTLQIEESLTMDQDDMRYT